MLIFCDESWTRPAGTDRLGTLAALAMPEDVHNTLDDRVFSLACKYWGVANAREIEIKGKKLLSPYEMRREAGGVDEPRVSLKLAFARELVEELRFQPVKIFASVVSAETDSELLCGDERLERPYRYLMERIHGYLAEQAESGVVVFDDRGIRTNERVAAAYRKFLTRTPGGRSYSQLVRTATFGYSKTSVGLQLADVICTIISRYHTDRDASPKIPLLYELVRKLEWHSAEAVDGFHLHGIKRIT